MEKDQSPSNKIHLFVGLQAVGQIGCSYEATVSVGPREQKRFDLRDSLIQANNSIIFFTFIASLNTSLLPFQSHLNPSITFDYYPSLDLPTPVSQKFPCRYQNYRVFNSRPVNNLLGCTIRSSSTLQVGSRNQSSKLQRNALQRQNASGHVLH